MRVLFLTPHPAEGASSRYRVLQYLPHLRLQGIHCTVSPFLTPRFYRIVYQQGRWGMKLGHFLVSSLKRLRDVIRSGRYDAVFIHLEAFPIGPPVIEWLFALRDVPMVFDLDDAIFLRRDNPANPIAAWLRMPQKLPAILRWSRCVITCNDYLRQYAEQFNPKVYMIPTCVDIEQFRAPPTRPSRPRPLIGWIGSHSTAPFLEPLKPVLSRLAKRFAFTFKVVGAARPFRLPGVEVIQEPWTLTKDVAYFQELDIGVYPLPVEPWVYGKTGFKTVQYMAVGTPCVVSNVGRNREIIQNGVNGFLAQSEDEWVDTLGHLLADPALRARFGLAGRKTVEERFAMQRYIPSYVNILRQDAGKRPPVGRGV
ncbi:MAG: glycosyltransferase family 4 protein [Candidatus Omnitrophota bacterium]|nr:glycosyltransferase family 4 protein [Candidatus Omnitrophota bacterium]